MIFGEIKGLRPHGGLGTAVVIVLAVFQLLGFFGYLGVFLDRNAEGRLVGHAFHWDTATIIYSVILWSSWAVVMSILLLSKESHTFKVGGSMILSLPVAVFVFSFFEWIKLGPR